MDSEANLSQGTHRSAIEAGRRFRFANYLTSGDDFETESPLTTPVGYFDGVSLLADGTTTRANDNYFGIHDLTGNVFEWIQGRYNTSGNSIAKRTYRGGSWSTSVDSDWMKNTRRSNTDPDNTHAILGLRVMRVPAAWGDDNGNGVIDLDDLRALSVCIGGPGPTELTSDCAGFDSGDGDVDLGDVGELFNLFGQTP